MNTLCLASPERPLTQTLALPPRPRSVWGDVLHVLGTRVGTQVGGGLRSGCSGADAVVPAYNGQAQGTGPLRSGLRVNVSMRQHPGSTRQ